MTRIFVVDGGELEIPGDRASHSELPPVVEDQHGQLWVKRDWETEWRRVAPLKVEYTPNNGRAR